MWLTVVLQKPSAETTQSDLDRQNPLKCVSLCACLEAGVIDYIYMQVILLLLAFQALVRHSFRRITVIKKNAQSNANYL